MASIGWQWALAVATGGLVFGVLACLNAPLALLSLGVWFGIPQSVVLRHCLRDTWLWAVATTIGMLAAWVVGFVAVLTIAALVEASQQTILALQTLAGVVDVTAWVFAFVLAGAVVGFAQSMLMPDNWRRRLRWIFSTSLGAVAFWGVLLSALVVFGGGWTETNVLIGGTPQVSPRPLFIGGGTLGGLAYGLITSTALSVSTPRRDQRTICTPGL